MFIYNQQNGNFSRAGALLANGYSGFDHGKNNPALEKVHDLGPIPRGKWTIELPPFQSETHGPQCLRLTPCEGTETFGRSGFLIHGDAFEHPGNASRGCIILPRSTRDLIGDSQDSELEVV